MRTLKMWLAALLSAAIIPVVPTVAGAAPNVLVIITDDQGYGDLSCQGNPVIRTPAIDSLKAAGVELANFYVSPVCSPTRSSLLTGRYNYRTGVVDTYLGRSMMHPDETTLAELLSAAGYRTGIFGKWHLGDDYPLRPQDQGFQDTLVHRGGGICQASGPPGDHYQDPVLVRNGVTAQVQGYCTDVFTDGAIEFIEQGHERPFFAYVAYNCPHDPLELPDEDFARFAKADLSKAAFPSAGWQAPAEYDAKRTMRVYGMIERIDRNVGRILRTLEKRGIADETIVVFLTDNGPAFARYNVGLRGLKGSVYEGGIRTACFIRFPSALGAGDRFEQPAAHIDLVPTLAAACGVALPEGRTIDGVNLWPVLTGQADAIESRNLFFQWHRGNVPQRRVAFAVRGPRFKLVQSAGGRTTEKAQTKFELYDLKHDPFEAHDLADRYPEVVDELLRAYDRWYDDVAAERHFEPPRIHLGSEHQDPVTLTRQDWRGPQATWSAEAVGYWEVEVASAGAYDVELRFVPTDEPRTARLRLGALDVERPVKPGDTAVRFEGVELPAGPGRLEAELVGGEQVRGANYVEVHRR